MNLDEMNLDIWANFLKKVSYPSVAEPFPMKDTQVTKKVPNPSPIYNSHHWKVPNKCSPRVERTEKKKKVDWHNEVL